MAHPIHSRPHTPAYQSSFMCFATASFQEGNCQPDIHSQFIDRAPKLSLELNRTLMFDLPYGGIEASKTVTSESVPEPSSILMSETGLAFLAFAARRRVKMGR